MKKVVALLAVLGVVLGVAPAFAEDYGTYDWVAAMSVADTTTNYKMMVKFA